MKQNSKLTIPDLISIGVFTALYFVLVTIATFGTAAILPGLSYVLLPAVSALLSGCVYMLFVAKVQKFGAITIMGLVMGAFFFSSGHFILSFAANVVCGILGDLIADGKLKNMWWYATMCDADGDLLAQCNIVRALHRMPKW